MHPPKDQVVESARAAGLRYVHDDRPGIRRLRRGKSFYYVSADGNPVRDKATLARIKSLVIPPAWTKVWICPLENGHLQATGWDARGRKQYRYHPEWRKIRDETKYERLAEFGQVLPVVRKHVDRALRTPGLSRTKVLATVVCLLESTHIRIGNEEYVRQNGSFGLTTLHDRHVRVSGSTIRFEFRAKAGIHWEVDVKNPRLARIVKRCQELPGEELFQYVDNSGTRHAIGSEDVNSYLRELTGRDFTAKDFRTWAGTVMAIQALQACMEFDCEAAAKRNIVGAIDTVARRLGNTRAVCKKCYIHPAIFDAYLAGSLREALQQQADAKRRRTHLTPEEFSTLTFLRQLSRRRKR